MRYTEISFPAFGITMNPNASFTIGPFTIHIYGLLIAAGLLLAVLPAFHQLSPPYTEGTIPAKIPANSYLGAAM